MGLTVLIALMAMAALMAPVGDGRTVDAFVVCAIAFGALAALAGPQGRARMSEALARHWLVAILFLGLLAWIVLGGEPRSAAAALARSELSFLVFVGLGLAGLTAAAATLRQGPTDAMNTFLAVGALAGVTTLLLATLSDLTLVSAPGLTGMCVLAVFAGCEGYRRAQRAAMHSSEPPPVARRLFLPAAAFVSCAVGVAATQDQSAFFAACAGILGLSALYLLRLRSGQRTAIGLLVGGALAANAALFGVVRALTGGTDAGPDYAGGAALALWRQNTSFGLGLDALAGDPLAQNAPAALRLLAETGLVGVGIVTAAAAAGLVKIALTPDRERIPSRGGALVAGLVAAAAVSALTSPALTQAAPAFVFACLLGLASVYGDRRRSSPAASAPQTAPARVGMQRL